jgi:two-component system sensor histidine kinase TctE
LSAPPAPPARLRSLRRQLLLGLLVPVTALLAFNAWSLYHQALAAADTAYDRTLLASAKAIGELLEVEAPQGRPQVRATLSYSALEAFEADNRSRLYYQVLGFDGEPVSGFDGLPLRRPPADAPPGDYAALVGFHDDTYRGEPVRVGTLLQPVAGLAGQGMATIVVAETLELRQALARRLLLDTLWRQLLLLALMAGTVVWVVQRATRPLRALGASLQQRDDDDLSPLAAPGAPREVQPVVEALNALLARVSQGVEHQKRFVRDASHQLRTPLAVLKVQVQSARRGDLAPMKALEEIEGTVDRATALANQMLALAKVEQLRRQGPAEPLDVEPVVRDVALELAPLAVDRDIDLGVDTAPARAAVHEWAVRELTRNLLHNALRHARSTVTLKLEATDDEVLLSIADNGAGLSPAVRQRLFEPFASGAPAHAPAGRSGLGLAICRDIAASFGGRITLEPAQASADWPGLVARVTIPRAAPLVASRPTGAVHTSVSAHPPRPLP